IPIVGATLLRQNIQLKKQLLAAQNIKKIAIPVPSESPLIEVNDGKTIHTFDLNKLLFVEANRNYIDVYQKDHPPQQIRLSMKGLGEQWASQPSIIRCHRAFFVVISQVQKVEGNAQGFQVSLQDSERLIPVSRTYIPAFKAKYEALGEA
ncbi:MAG: LytTR family DNA-binding domain-containing protein, partial [Bacteroidota bacterium]